MLPSASWSHTLSFMLVIRSLMFDVESKYWTLTPPGVCLGAERQHPPPHISSRWVMANSRNIDSNGKESRLLYDHEALTYDQVLEFIPWHLPIFLPDRIAASSPYPWQADMYVWCLELLRQVRQMKHFCETWFFSDHGTISLLWRFPYRSGLVIPGNSVSVARQFLRCALHQLAPNGIFPQVFQTELEGRWYGGSSYGNKQEWSHKMGGPLCRVCYTVFDQSTSSTNLRNGVGREHWLTEGPRLKRECYTCRLCRKPVFQSYIEGSVRLGLSTKQETKEKETREKMEVLCQFNM